MDLKSSTKDELSTTESFRVTPRSVAYSAPS
jgi:hypothetical protein